MGEAGLVSIGKVLGIRYYCDFWRREGVGEVI